MSDDAPAVDPPAAPAPKSPKKAKKPRAPAGHPKTMEMIVAAIGNLKERNGSSLQAIKKYVAGNYKVDIEKITPFIRRALKAGVTKGDLVQTKGKGASGSFKLNPKAKAEKPKKAKKAAKPKTAKPKKPKAKKPAAKPKKQKAKKPKAAAKAKKPKAKAEKKAKKVKKTKAPKPKKSPAKKAAKPKKAAAKPKKAAKKK
ncbi:histone H1-like [Ptychodera flava]|uniref:histone H1-like n=1 Tax=Ptychodera flava TaxID=63121 RepID=UPI00396A438D